MSFNNKVRNTIRSQNSLVCVGLDVVPERIPDSIKKSSDPIFQFNKAIIDATKEYVIAYKPNLAFYEALGSEGWDILKKTVSYIPDGIIKIGDAKRGDIGSTAEQYAKGLWNLGFDAVTLNPYLGKDAIMPFIQDEDRGVFILCLTSNPSSMDFQKQKINGSPFYLKVAEKIEHWNEKGNCGLVAGATHGSELERIRKIAPTLPFLIPGIGAQGGDLTSVVLAGTDHLGEMAAINSSRGVLYASSGQNFAEEAGKVAHRLREEINYIRRKKRYRNQEISKNKDEGVIGS
ncbi:orotidine-5'-phosphate decarboxylase [bacterium]|nr:orotidine-5'-phosphate decarboxylase [bacterium]